MPSRTLHCSRAVLFAAPLIVLAPAAELDAQSPAPTAVVRFEITSLTPADADPPRARIALVIETPGAAPRRLPLRDVTGHCTAGDSLQPGAIAIHCWWAGQGDSWKVERHGGSVAIVWGSEDEGAPTTQYRTVQRFHLDPHVALQIVVTPH